MAETKTFLQELQDWVIQGFQFLGIIALGGFALFALVEAARFVGVFIGGLF